MPLVDLGRSKSLNRIAVPIFLLVVVIGLPISTLLLYVGIDMFINNGEALFLLTILIVLGYMWFVILRHLHLLYSYPLIQFDENFLIFSEMLSGRKVYNLEDISKPKKVFNSVFFIYNGWPAFLNLYELTNQEREQLWTIID